MSRDMIINDLKENLTKSEIQELVNDIVNRMDSNLKDTNDETTDIEFEISTTSEKEISEIFSLLNDTCSDKYIDYEIENEETYPEGKYYYATLNRKYPDDYYFDYESEETTWATEPGQKTGKYKTSNKELEEATSNDMVIIEENDHLASTEDPKLNEIGTWQVVRLDREDIAPYIQRFTENGLKTYTKDNWLYVTGDVDTIIDVAKHYWGFYDEALYYNWLSPEPQKIKDKRKVLFNESAEIKDNKFISELEELKNREIVENMQDKKYIVFDHFNPDTLYFVKNIPDDSWIWDSDWIIEDVTDKHGNCLIENNDEYISVDEMGDKTLSDFDKEIIASLKQAIQEDPDEDYLCAYTSEDREFCFEKDELPDDLDSMTPFTDFVEDSYVDGDSNSQYQVINLDTEEFGEFGVDIFVDEDEDLEEAMTNKEKLMKKFPELNLNEPLKEDSSRVEKTISIDEIAELCGGYKQVQDIVEETKKGYPGIACDELAEMTYHLCDSDEVSEDEWASLIEYVCSSLEENFESGANSNKLNKQEVLDWISEHELAWEDFVNYFEDIYQSSAEVPMDEIIGWIIEHDELAEDFEARFNAGIFTDADVYDDDMGMFDKSEYGLEEGLFDKKEFAVYDKNNGDKIISKHKTQEEASAKAKELGGLSKGFHAENIKAYADWTKKLSNDKKSEKKVKGWGLRDIKGNRFVYTFDTEDEARAKFNKLGDSQQMRFSVDPILESIDNKEEKWNIGSNKLVSTDSQEYANLVDLAKLLQERSPNGYEYRVKKTYEDFGAGMQWYTVVCDERNGWGTHQVLNTKQWLDLANTGNVEGVYQDVVSNKDFQDTIEKGKTTALFNHMNSLED